MLVDTTATRHRKKRQRRYAARLVAAGLVPSGGYSAEGVAEAARRAKLPVGHRMRLALVCKQGGCGK